MTVPADCPPPPRRMDPVRVEALRAAAKVHEGDGPVYEQDLHEWGDPVLETADRFVTWLQGEQT